MEAVSDLLRKFPEKGENMSAKGSWPPSKEELEKLIDEYFNKVPASDDKTDTRKRPLIKDKNASRGLGKEER